MPPNEPARAAMPLGFGHVLQMVCRAPADLSASVQILEPTRECPRSGSWRFTQILPISGFASELDQLSMSAHCRSASEPKAVSTDSIRRRRRSGRCIRHAPAAAGRSSG